MRREELAKWVCLFMDTVAKSALIRRESEFTRSIGD
jgi:hypothetical protein